MKMKATVYRLRGSHSSSAGMHPLTKIFSRHSFCWANRTSQIQQNLSEPTGTAELTSSFFLIS